MSVHKTLIISLCAALFCAGPAFAGEKKGGEGEKKGPSNEIKAAVPANYIQIPHMRLTMTEEASQQPRQLEVEAWISAKGPEDLALLSSNKKKINAAVKEDFMAYRWEAFSQPTTGMEVAKAVVSHAVQRAVGVKPDEVVMRVLILR